MSDKKNIKNKKSDKDKDYFEEHTYTSHNGYTKKNNEDPVYYKKCYRHRKDPYDSSSDEEPFDETIHENIMKNINNNLEKMNKLNSNFINTGKNKKYNKSDKNKSDKNKSDKKHNKETKSDKKNENKSKKEKHENSGCNFFQPDPSKFFFGPEFTNFLPQNFNPFQGLNYGNGFGFENNIPDWQRKIQKDILKNQQFFNNPYGGYFYVPFGPFGYDKNNSCGDHHHDHKHNHHHDHHHDHDHKHGHCNN
ncbi:hypothetical protein H012_gp246 [Acanthamoeba polyphaga moumouvirus]|uniref:Uncharacterized protein n=1 Tax=Acanthamoeba polyphaga moumouvirus TaxID=1269028 RepID=L7RD55_9VIRU|nr:hypothetical protein H012_gp246 [Acanthamoeba polyphaga moumouvirus]AGC02206.1 hypothetical protein Moumou_00685 [Acanthamoeba polyphaga moumouvirus]